MIEVNLPTPPRRGLQFSLRTAFIALVLVAVAMSLWVSSRQAQENLRLRAENTRLRNETGQLTIEPGEDHKVHAIKIAALESYTWRWRIHVPEGRPITLRATNETAYDDGKPAGSGSNSVRLSPGECLIALALRRSLKGRWEWIVQQTDGSGSSEGRSGLSLDADSAELLLDNNSSNASGVYQSTQSVEPGRDLELLNLKMSTPTNRVNFAGRKLSEIIQVVIHDGTP
jgi:hypothetical protein